MQKVDEMQRAHELFYMYVVHIKQYCKMHIYLKTMSKYKNCYLKMWLLTQYMLYLWFFILKKNHQKIKMFKHKTEFTKSILCAMH